VFSPFWYFVPTKIWQPRFEAAAAFFLLEWKTNRPWRPLMPQVNNLCLSFFRIQTKNHLFWICFTLQVLTKVLLKVLTKFWRSSDEKSPQFLSVFTLQVLNKVLMKVLTKNHHIFTSAFYCKFCTRVQCYENYFRQFL
jgi:hypothetical protein